MQVLLCVMATCTSVPKVRRARRDSKQPIVAQLIAFECYAQQAWCEAGAGSGLCCTRTTSQSTQATARHTMSHS